MKAVCPCCGGDIKAIDPQKLLQIVSPTFAEMVTRLLKSPGEYVRTEELARYIWRRDPNGGPESPAININNLVSYNKRRLTALGWEVVGRMGRHGGYMLRVSEAAQ